MSSAPQTWLITGGAGYIGAHIADEFLSNGKKVVIYDSLYQGLESRIQYLRTKHDTHIPLIIADIRELATFEQTLKELWTKHPDGQDKNSIFSFVGTP